MGRRFDAIPDRSDRVLRGYPGQPVGDRRLWPASYWHVPATFWFAAQSWRSAFISPRGAAGCTRWPRLAFCTCRHAHRLAPRARGASKAITPGLPITLSRTSTVTAIHLCQQSGPSRHAQGGREPAPAYMLPYLLNRDSGGRKFDDVLIIGAGSGNDVAAALRRRPSTSTPSRSIRSFTTWAPRSSQSAVCRPQGYRPSRGRPGFRAQDRTTL